MLHQRVPAPTASTGQPHLSRRGPTRRGERHPVPTREPPRMNGTSHAKPSAQCRRSGAGSITAYAGRRAPIRHAIRTVSAKQTGRRACGPRGLFLRLVQRKKPAWGRAGEQMWCGWSGLRT